MDASCTTVGEEAAAPLVDEAPIVAKMRPISNVMELNRVFIVCLLV
jgi:hypothetical protein